MEISKVIADPIHGMMTFEPYLIKIMNHRYFQRLRHIKQLQGTDHVYPNGIHSRFSHCLGVCFLAGRVLDKLKTQFETEKTEKDVKDVKDEDILEDFDFDRKCVQIAALCHDIGHGPFSHLYEIISKEIDDTPCTHEKRSQQITDEIIEELQLFENDRRGDAKVIIGDMIKGKKIGKMTDDERKKAYLYQIYKHIEITDYKTAGFGLGKKIEDMTDEEINKAYLYQIVSNEDTKVDVDKWDYFLRDSHACGFPSNFDKERAICMLRVCDYEYKDKDGKQKNARVLTFPLKDQINMYNMFLLRFTLHSKVYQHPVVKCVEEMIADVLKLADNTMILEGNTVSTKECREPNAVARYCLMDDRLLYLIHHAADESPVFGDTQNNVEDLQNAKAIIDRIHQRDFYQLAYNDSHPQVNEMGKKDKERLEKKLKDEFLGLKEVKGNKELLKEIEELGEKRPLFRIKIKKVNCGNGNENPVPNVYFYGKGENSATKTNGKEKSPMIPKYFEEKTLLVICTLHKETFNFWNSQEWRDFVNRVLKSGDEKDVKPPQPKKARHQ